MNAYRLKQLSAAIMLAGAANSIYALGLGKMELTSTLGEPLSAVVHLMDSKDFAASEIVAEIADAAAYKRMSIERPFFHQNLQLLPVIKNDGYILQLRSDKPVKEPFLNIVISLRWPKGSLLKEYTVLLDLPAVPTVTNTQARIAPLQATNNKSSNVPALKLANHSVTASSNASSYVSQPGDSLWSIAKVIQRNQKAPIAKIMQALFVHNPNAFIRNDPGRLKPAYKFLIPSSSDIRSAANLMPTKKVIAKTVSAVPQPFADSTVFVADKAATTEVLPDKLQALKSQKADNLLARSILKAEDMALRKRIIELELLSAELKEKLMQMNEKALHLTDEMNKPLKELAEQGTAMLVTDAVASENKTSYLVKDAAQQIEATVVTENNQILNELSSSTAAVENEVAVTAPENNIFENDKTYPAVSRQNISSVSPLTSVFESVRQHGLIVFSSIAFLATMSVWLLLLRKIKRNKRLQQVNLENAPFWEMPAQDLSHVHIDSKMKSAFKQPELSYSEEDKLRKVS